MGLGDSMLNDENPIVTSLRYAVTGAALGAGFGVIEGKIAPKIAAKISRENNIKAAVKFFKEGKVSGNLEKITVTVDELAEKMPELKLFAEKTSGVKITFAKNMLAGGKYNHYNDVIIINIEKFADKEVLFHELQHAIDIREILNNPADKALQEILHSSIIANRDMSYVLKNNIELISRYKKLRIEGKLNSAEDFEREFGEIEREIIKSWYNEYYKDYFEDLLERRAFETAMKGAPNERTLKETIEKFKQNRLKQ